MVRITSGIGINIQSTTAVKEESVTPNKATVQTPSVKQEGVTPSPLNIHLSSQEQVAQAKSTALARISESRFQTTAQKIQLGSFQKLPGLSFGHLSFGSKLTTSGQVVARPGLQQFSGTGQVAGPGLYQHLQFRSQSLLKAASAPDMIALKPISYADKKLQVDSLMQQIQRMSEQITRISTVGHQIAINSIKNLRA